jgi:hypothetical protein
MAVRSVTVRRREARADVADPVVVGLPAGSASEVCHVASAKVAPGVSSMTSEPQPTRSRARDVRPARPTDATVRVTPYVGLAAAGISGRF